MHHALTTVGSSIRATLPLPIGRVRVSRHRSADNPARDSLDAIRKERIVEELVVRT